MSIEVVLLPIYTKDVEEFIDMFQRQTQAKAYSEAMLQRNFNTKSASVAYDTEQATNSI